MPGKKRQNREQSKDKPRRPRAGEEEREQLDERVLQVARTSKVLKGGRRFAFRTVVIVGDNRGRVGIGVGKSRGVPDSIRQGSERARKKMNRVSLSGSTIPYPRGDEVTRRGGAIGSHPKTDSPIYVQTM